MKLFGLDMKLDETPCLGMSLMKRLVLMFFAFFPVAGRGGPAKNIYFYMSRTFGVEASRIRYCLQVWWLKPLVFDAVITL